MGVLEAGGQQQGAVSTFAEGNLDGFFGDAHKGRGLDEGAEQVTGLCGGVLLTDACSEEAIGGDWP